MADSLLKIKQEIIRCTLCPRLVEYREAAAREKRRAYMAWDYWGKPVPGFGDQQARLLIIGLAPAAHGGNRTGRVFTGDSSGDFLYAALHQSGFASQSHSISRDDGMTLRDAYINATVRCAPPDNKPLPAESRNCRPYLERELDALGMPGRGDARLRCVICLGKIAFDRFLAILTERKLVRPRFAYRFAHGAEYTMDAILPTPLTLLTSYHPSPRNTQTGRLTPAMFLSVFERAKMILRH
ncbi:MAG: uracil-DNA glycosylase [Acidobacteria bacterium]|nr:uracil-DNA glycosylase [Acidobacteriota bacterium]